MLVTTDNKHYADIAESIREKTNTTEAIKPEEMASKIDAITVGEVLPERAYKITGDCSYMFYGNGWNWYMQALEDKLTTENITKSDYMFKNCNAATNIPFEINFASSANGDLTEMFSSCSYLEELPKMNNLKVTNLKSVFSGCNRLREIPEDYFDNWDFSTLGGYTNTYSGNMSGMFNTCRSLRKIPENLLTSFKSITCSNAEKSSKEYLIRRETMRSQ